MTETSWVGEEVMSVVRGDRAAWAAACSLTEAGGDVYAVGGVVRDVALETRPNDVDLMVRELTREKVRETLEALPGRVSEVGKSFGILEYRGLGGCAQVALPRQDRFIGVHHTDVDVHVDPWMPVEEDLERRDYTVNAMAVKIPEGELVDPLDGLGDALMGLLRAVSMEVLADDPLRVLRGVVLAARRGLRVDEHTAEMLAASVDSVLNLPADRIHDELDKLLESTDPVYGVRLAQELGLLRVILPEVAATYGYNQNNKHHELDLFEHTMQVLEAACDLTDDKDVRLAALLHDVGKPDSAWTDEDGYTHFYEKLVPLEGDLVEVLGADHEVVGARMTQSLMGRLRYSTSRSHRVTSLVRHHMWAEFDTHRGARRFLARVGFPLVNDLLTLRRADGAGKTAAGFNYRDESTRLERLIDEVLKQESAVTVRDLEIDGYDLIELDVPAGPERGLILHALLDKVIDDPEMNDRETLIGLVESLRDDSRRSDPGQGGLTT